MLERNYEKRTTIIIFIILFLIITVLFSLYLYFGKITNNILLSGVINSKETIEILVNDEELNLLYQNKTFYIDDEKKTYEIRKVTLKVLEKNNIYYHDIIIKTEISKKYKENDNLKITLKKNKKRLIEIFKLIWRGD